MTKQRRADSRIAAEKYAPTPQGSSHLIIEHGPDWNFLIRCTVTLNRQDGGEEQIA